jgi:hypothetical protein
MAAWSVCFAVLAIGYLAFLAGVKVGQERGYSAWDDVRTWSVFVLCMVLVVLVLAAICGAIYWYPGWIRWTVITGLITAVLLLIGACVYALRAEPEETEKLFLWYVVLQIFYRGNDDQK